MNGMIMIYLALAGNRFLQKMKRHRSQVQELLHPLVSFVTNTNSTTAQSYQRRQRFPRTQHC